MHASPRRKLLLAVGTCIALSATVGAAPARDEGGHAAHAAEQARIRRHFDSVLTELRAPTGRALGPAQRAARARHLETLAAYRDRGVFPHNHDFSESWMPYFVDHRGVLCAVAFLLESSGRRDIVERVRAADNNVWVAQLAGDTAFAAWLDASGLTLGEAARIQVPYVETPDDDVTASGSRANVAAMATATTLGVASMVWSARADDGRHRVARAALGFAAGAASAALMATQRDAAGMPTAVRATAGAVGIGSTFMAARALLVGGAPRTHAAPATTDAARLSVAPAMVASGERLAPGVTLNVRF